MAALSDYAFAAVNVPFIPGASSARVRPLEPADLDALMDIQRACYGAAYVEPRSVFTRRLASPANCSLVVESAGEVVAYLAAYWSKAGKITPLHGDFEACADPDVLYLHDMAVLPAQAGQRLASRLLGPLWEQARHRGIRQSCLVSVQGTQDYWQRHGYRRLELQDAQQLQQLASYGKDAIYMQCLLDSPSQSGDNASYA